MLDNMVGVLVELCGVCEQGSLVGMVGESREVMEGFSQVRMERAGESGEATQVTAAGCGYQYCGLMLIYCNCVDLP
jgi:hypothetical protein